MRVLWALMWLLGTMALAAPPAVAQFNFLPEVRAGLGLRGLEANQQLLDPERVEDANVELLFTAPDLNSWTFIGELRPHLGATMSFRGKDSYGYAGLSWTFQAPLFPLFVEASAGGVVRSAMFSAPAGDPSRAIGCGVGVRVAGSVGLNLPFGTALIATAEHLPDFGTCGVPDRAATNVSLKLGLRF